MASSKLHFNNSRDNLLCIGPCKPRPLKKGYTKAERETCYYSVWGRQCRACQESCERKLDRGGRGKEDEEEKGREGRKDGVRK